MDWDDLIRTLLIKDARIVATVSLSGGAIVEQHPAIEFIEGRREESEGGEDGPSQASLAYYASFGLPDIPAPDASEATQATIIIDGGSDYGPIEIRGVGHIGYDDRGNVEGWFDTPPAILLDDMPERPDAANDDPMTPEQWLKHMRGVEPKPSEQYKRALRGRDRYDWD